MRKQGEIKTETIEVAVKVRKNGDFYANISKLDLPISYKTISKKLSQSNGKEFKSITLICSWNINDRYNSVKVIWNEK